MSSCYGKDLENTRWTAYDLQAESHMTDKGSQASTTAIKLIC